MPLFKINFRDWESDYTQLLEHPTKTIQEFDTDLENFIREGGEDYINQEECFVGNVDWFIYILPKFYAAGYKEPVTHDLYFKQRDILKESDEQWKELVGEGLFNKAIEKNNK